MNTEANEISVETHTKIVKGKTVLVPSLALFRQHLPQQLGLVDTAQLRQTLETAYGRQMVCPLTIKRHLKTLGPTTKPK